MVIAIDEHHPKILKVKVGQLAHLFYLVFIRSIFIDHGGIARFLPSLKSDCQNR